MQFSTPIILSFLALCHNVASQWTDDYEDSQSGLLQARDTYLAARSEYIEARDFHDVITKLYIRDADDDAGLSRRDVCARCGIMSSTGILCRHCRTANSLIERARLSRESAALDWARRHRTPADHDAAKALMKLKYSAPKDHPRGSPK